MTMVFGALMMSAAARFRETHGNEAIGARAGILRRSR